MICSECGWGGQSTEDIDRQQQVERRKWDPAAEIAAAEPIPAEAVPDASIDAPGETASSKRPAARVSRRQIDIPALKARVRISTIFQAHGVTPDTAGMARCPWHEDRTPSLHIDDERGFFKCHGCDAKGDHLSAIRRFDGSDFKAALAELQRMAGEMPATALPRPTKPERVPPRFPIPDTAAPALNKKLARGKIRDGDTWVRIAEKHGLAVAGWRWHDCRGNWIFSTARHEKPSGKEVLPYYFGQDQKWHLGNPLSKNRPLFRLHELLASSLPILLVEGEKCASVEVPGYILTTWQGGTGAVAQTDFSPLVDRDTTVWPDADKTGFSAAVKIRDRLPHARILRIEGKPKGWDIADAAAEGMDLAAFIAECPVVPVMSAAGPDTAIDEEEASAESAKPAAAGGGSGGKRGPSAATVLLEKLFDTDALLFHDGDETFCSFGVNSHTESAPLRSRHFRRHLSWLYFDALGSAPSGKAIEEALGVLDAKARHDGPEIPVYSRYAPDGAGGIFIDLGNDEWNAVHITPGGWKVDGSPCRFVRTGGMKPLAIPVPGGSPEELREFWNIGTDRQFRLAIVFLLQAMRPVGPYVGEEVNGLAGTGKTLFVETQKAILDPNIAPVRSSPRDEVDLVIAARGSRCPCFGNLSRLSFDQSDALCRLSDGAGLGKRTLYSDLDETIAWVQRPFILNGINPVAHSADLLDRLFRISLPAIPEDCRKRPEEYWASWNAAYPRILGTFYDLLARTLAALPTIERPTMLPRMADVALFGIAVEKAAGWPEDSFMEAYRENIQAADESALDSSPVFEVLEKRITDRWEGTATDLLLELERHEDTCDLVRRHDATCDLETALSKRCMCGKTNACTCGMTKRMRERAWPKNGRSLSSALRRLLPNAERMGWKIIFGRDGESKSRSLTIEKGSNDVPF